MEEEAERQPENLRQLEIFDRVAIYLRSLRYKVVSENALNFYCIICWLIVVLEMVISKYNKEGENSEEGIPLFAFTLLSIGAILIAISGISKKPILLVPLFVMSLLNGIRTFFYAVILLFHQYEPPGLDKKLLPVNVVPEWESTLLYSYSLASCFWFFVTLIILIFLMDFRRAEEIRRNNSYPIHEALVRHPQPIFLLNQRDEFVETYIDNPPNYSLIIRETPEQVHTAKEETSPPRYSQLNSIRH